MKIAVYFLTLIILCAGDFSMMTRAAGAFLTPQENQAEPAIQSVISGYSIIYARRQNLGPGFPIPSKLPWEIVWQPSKASIANRVLYVAGRKTFPQDKMPVYLGYLPSPNGRWLCVRETSYLPRPDKKEYDRRTVWTVVEAPGDRRYDVHTEQGLTGYLPVWLDNAKLELEKGEISAVFDVQSGKLTGKLPENPRSEGRYDRDVDDGAAAASWQRQYLHRYYEKELVLADQAVRSIEGLGIRSYLNARPFPHPDTIADLLLRPMGIVGLWGNRAAKEQWPGIAISPDHKLIAVTTVVPSGEVVVLDARGNFSSANMFEAAIRVFDLDSRKQLWSYSTPWGATSAGDVAGLGSLAEPWLGDARWSSNSRYLSFTEHHRDYDLVSIVDRLTWKEVVRIPNASNAFLVPAGGNSGTDY